MRIPEQRIDPPELSDEEFNRNLRNNYRREAIQALDTLMDNLDLLDHDGAHRHTQMYLEDLHRYLMDDMED